LPKLQTLQAALTARRAFVATAESCTGGLVATLLTALPGSSTVFLGGVSAYADAAKTALLGVDATLLAQFGAVSAEVAAAMAAGARSRFGATWAVSLTGIAGPDGARPGKPVGTVFAGLAGPQGTEAVRWTLAGDREAVRWQAAENAIEWLLKEVSK
jgi:nicotinamide-nucleotide amidase